MHEGTTYFNYWRRRLPRLASLRSVCSLTGAEVFFHGYTRRWFELLRHDVTFPLYVEEYEIYNLACPASRFSANS